MKEGRPLILCRETKKNRRARIRKAAVITALAVATTGKPSYETPMAAGSFIDVIPREASHQLTTTILLLRACAVAETHNEDVQ